MKRILLYPGGFKPFHDGHLRLLRNACQYNDIDEVWLMMSGKSRDCVTDELSKIIIDPALEKLSDIFNIDTDLIIFQNRISPIERCYYFATHGPDDFIYSMLTSDKDSDLKRSIDFYESFKIGAKYNDGIWNNDRAFELNPETYNIIKYKGNVISATDVRKTIADNDFKKFLTYYDYMLTYGYTNRNILTEFWDKARYNLYKKM